MPGSTPPTPSRRSRRPLAALAAALLAGVALLGPVSAAQAAETNLGVESVDGWSGVSFDSSSGTGVPAAVSNDAHSGSASLAIDLDTTTVTDGGWEMAYRALPSVAVDSLTFWVKAQNASSLGVQLIDSTGQTHQTFLPLAATDQWQEVTLASLTDDPSHGAWGGAADGVWHGPATQLGFVLNAFARADTSVATASLLIDDIVAHTADAPSSLTLGQSTAGNVFAPGEPTAFPYSTGADELHWRVADAAGAPVASGTQAVSAPTGTLTLDGLDLGWYSLAVDATREGAAVGHAETTFARVADPSAADQDGRFAAATHYGQSWSTDSMPLLAAGGFPQLRDEVYWNEVETQPGVYDWSRPRSEFLDEAEQQGVKPLLLAGYGNPLYDAGNGPKSPEAVAAYSAYAASMASEFADVATGIEVWNEWDLGLGGNTNTSAADYVNLLKSAAPAIKAAAPNLPVIGPAVADLNTSWLEDAFKLGALQYVDGIVLHPYSYPAGAEALDARLEQVDALVKKYNGGQSKPIYITEHGWPTGTDARAVSETSQAANIAKSALIAAMNGVAKYYVYDFVNDGTDATETEQNFGLVHSQDDPLGAFTPKPSYVAYSTAAHQLSGATFADRDTSIADVWNIGYNTPTGPLRALWAVSPQTVQVQATGTVTVTDAYGAAHTVDAGAGTTLTLALSDAPVYVAGALSSAVPSATSLALDPAFVGQPVSAHWTMDNTTGGSATEFALAFTDGTRVTQTVAAGATSTVDLTLPAPTTTGAYSVSAQLTQGDAFVGTLRASTTASEALGLTGEHAIDADGRSVLRLRVSNAGTAATSVEELSYTLGDASGSLTTDTALPATSSVESDVLLDGLTDPTAWSASATVDGRVLTASGTVSPLDVAGASPVAYRSIDIDGVLDDLAGVPSIDLATQGTDETVGSTGPADLSGTVWYTWDDDNLYLSADIADDVHDQPSAGSTIWQGDSIQFTVAAGAPGEATAWNEIGVALTASGPQLYRWLSVGEGSGTVTGSQVAITRDDAAGRTVYEVAVPWSRLGGIRPDTALVSSSMLVNEADGAGRAGYLGWGGGIAAEKDSAQFHALRLLPAPVDPEPGTGEPGTPGTPGAGASGTSAGGSGSGSSGAGGAAAAAEGGALAATGAGDAAGMLGGALLLLAVGGAVVLRHRRLSGTGQPGRRTAA